MTVEKILVTGASGLLGANVCRIAVEQGRRVRGLVRKAADAEVLKTLGVTLTPLHERYRQIG